MMGKNRHLKSIFSETLEMDNPRERAAYLDKACAGDPELRNQVEELLSAMERGPVS